MKYQFNLGNDELVAVDKDKVEEFTTSNPNATFDSFVNDDAAGKTDPSKETEDAPVEDKDTASNSENGSLGSPGNEETKGTEVKPLLTKTQESKNQIEKLLNTPENNSVLYKNYQKATEVTDQEIQEQFVRDYFELDKIDERRGVYSSRNPEGTHMGPTFSSPDLTQYGGYSNMVRTALPYDSQEVRNVIPLSRIEDYDKWIKGEFEISELDKFTTEKKIKENKADDYFLTLSEKDVQRTSDILLDKNLKIDSLKENLKIQSNEVDELVNQSNEELKPIEDRLEEVGKKLERINDIYSGFVQPTDEKLSEFNNLKIEYENLFSQRQGIIENYTTKFEDYNKTLKDWQIKAEDYAGNAAGFESSKKNYKILSQVGTQLEKQVLGAGYSTLGKFGSEILKNSINYNEGLDKKIGNFPRRLQVDEVNNASDFGRFFVETITDQALSIGAALLPFAGKFVKGGKYLASFRNTGLGLFGVSSFGNRAFEMEKRDLDISGRIGQINTALDKKDISREEYLELFLEKNELENIEPYSEVVKNVVPALNAVSEIFTEKMGSMRYVEGLADMGKTLSRMKIKQALPYALKAIPKNVAIENTEEITNQAFVNIFDKHILGENKSLLDGVTPDMIARTSVTSLAIGGPGIFNNVHNIIKREFLTKAERAKLTEKAEEFIALGVEYENKNITRKEFNKKRKEILNKLGLDQMVSLNKLNYLSVEDVQELGLLNLEMENLLKNTAALSANTRTSTEYKENELEKAKEEYRKLSEQREGLLGKKVENNEFTPDQAFAYGIYELNLNIAKTLGPKNGKVIILNEKSRNELIEKTPGLSKEGKTQEEKNEIDRLINGMNTSNAFNQGNNIYVNEDLIVNTIVNSKNGTSLEVLFAAASPAHELFHIKIGSDKIIINNKLQGDLKYAARGLRTTLKEKFESGRIKNKEAYEAILARLDSYSKREGKDGKLDIEEYFTTIFDAYNLGLITDSEVSIDYAMKTIVEKALSIIHPNANTFGLINNTRDAFNYIKSFNKATRTSGIRILGQDEDSEIQFSENIASLYDQYGKDHTAMIEEGSKLNKDGEFVEDITKSEFGQSIGGLVETITKRLFDGTLNESTKIINSDRFIARDIFKKEVTQEAAIMVLNEYNTELGSIDKFITSRLNLRANSKLKDMGVMPSVKKGGLGMATEATDDTLKGQEQTEQNEDQIDEAKDDIKLKKLDTKISFKRDGQFVKMNEVQIPGETVTEVIDDKKITRPKTFSDNVLDAVIKTFQTKLPNVNEKAFIKKFDTANQAEIVPLLQEEFEKENFKLFLQNNENVDGILGKLPQSVINKRFKTLGKKIGRETVGAGKGIFEKTNVTQREFIEYFAGPELASNVRSDRKKSLIKVLSNELAADATLDAISNPDVIEKLGIQGVVVNKAWTNTLLKAIERDQLSIDDLKTRNEAANIKFSNFIGELNSQGQSLDYAYDFVQLFKTDRGKAENKNPGLYQSILEDENINIKWKALETEVLNNLKAASAKIPGLKVVSTQVAKNDNKTIDMQLVANGNKIGIEVKLDEKARMGTAGTITQNENGEYIFNAAKGTGLETLLESNNPEVIELKKRLDNFFNFLSEKEGKEIRLGTDKGLETVEISASTVKELQKTGLQAKVGQTYLEIPITAFYGFYRDKDTKGFTGEYIIINNKLYSLGNDPLNTNAPKLDSNMTVNIRIKGGAIKKHRDKKSKEYKPEGERDYTYKVTAEIRLKDKNKNWNFNDSNIELNTPKDYVNTFSNVKLSKNLEKEMNSMIGRTKGVDIEKTFSAPQARRLGEKAERIRLFVPNTAEDLLGLSYRFLGKGKQGDKDMQFFKDNLFNPLTEANIKFEAEQVKSEKYLAEAKEIIAKQGVDLTAEAIDGYTNDHVIRIFMWNRRGYKVPDLDPETLGKKPGPEQAKIVKYARQNFDIIAISDAIEAAYPDLQYGKPNENWVTGTITTDLLEFTNEVTRQEVYKKFFDNVQGMFGKFDTRTGRLSGTIANKIRATYGNTFIKALESSMYRIYTGRNRSYQLDDKGNIMLDWMNNAIGNIMFINSRSALLQTISHINFTNWTDNNPLEVGKAWKNHKQFSEDFKTIFFSDYLKARRSGLRTDVQEQEIAEAAKNSKNDIRSMIAVVLKKGFMPTQYADSFAIALGGASFYRNRTNTYVKQGMDKADAEQKAFGEMREIAEDTQQSGRPEKISMEQSGLGGRLILAFQNTPMQYNRLIKRSIQDLYNGRGDAKTNISKIIYYGIVQNALFYSLQMALFAVIFDSPETTDEEKKEKQRYYRLINGMSDSILRGSGMFGALVSTGKNTLLKVLEREGFDEKAIEEIANLSPPLGKKTRQLFDIRDKFQYKQNKQKIKELGLDTRNPAILAAADALSFGINLPADRALKKINNLRTASEKETEMWQRIALALGWSNWELNIDLDKENRLSPKIKGGIKDGIKQSKIK